MPVKSQTRKIGLININPLKSIQLLIIFSFVISGGSIPNTTDILGVQPRYHLRSGYAGLQIDEGSIINEVKSCLNEMVHILVKLKVKICVFVSLPVRNV